MFFISFYSFWKFLELVSNYERAGSSTLACVSKMIIKEVLEI